MEQTIRSPACVISVCVSVCLSALPWSQYDKKSRFYDPENCCGRAPSRGNDPGILFLRFGARDNAPPPESDHAECVYVCILWHMYLCCIQRVINQSSVKKNTIKRTCRRCRQMSVLATELTSYNVVHLCSCYLIVVYS